MSFENSSSTPQGVMDASYAAGRLKKPHLNYRYKVRAEIAFEEYKAIHPYPHSVRLLEMGAAEGLTLLQLRERFRGDGEFDGVEYAQDLLDSAPALPDNVRLMRGDVTALPEAIKAENYHLCTCLAVLEHLEDPLACVQEAFRILKPGGIFVATCPHPFWDDVAGKLGMVEDDYHEQEVTMEFLSDLAEQSGFVRVQTKPFMWTPTGVLPYFGPSFSPTTSLKIDGWVRRLKWLDFSFVNQVLIAQKPLSFHTHHGQS
jgi:ubiquinone/menaquinone biosynthesis C-methylase UbiE